MLYNRANPRWGRSQGESRPYFERVLALEPDNVPALHHLARLDASDRYTDSLARRADAMERVAPNSEWAVDVRTMSIFASHDSAQIARFLAGYAKQTLLVQIYAGYNAMRFSDDARDMERLLTILRGGGVNRVTGLPENVSLVSDISLWLDALSYLFHGNYDAARAFLVDPGRRRTPTWDVWDAELVATGLVPVDSALLSKVVTRLRAVDPAERMRTKFEPLHDIFTTQVAALERDFTLAKLLARQGKVDEAWAIQRRLAALPPFTAFESLRDDAATSLAAELHFLAGDKRKALDLLRTLRFQVPQTANSLSITSGSHARYLRAELELELGDPAVARGFYAGLVESFTPADKLFLATSYERLGRIDETSGRLDDAIHYYEKFVRAWAECDPALVPQRRAVQARLDALRGKQGRGATDGGASRQ
jgi:tetratricopeptide (TPR) repeat protein